MEQSNLITKWKSWAPCFQSILRIVAAFIFIQSGTMKIFGFPVEMPGDMKLDILSQVGVGGILEVVGGALLLLGLFTCPVAFILAGQMAVAYLQFHAPQGFWTLENGGGDALLFCFLWLYFSAAGGGPWSLDALRKK